MKSQTRGLMSAVFVSVSTLLAGGGCAVGPTGDTANNLTAEETGQVAQEIRRPRAPTPVVFDTDMDFDDAAALAYLCQEHQQGHIQLRAVTVARDGASMPGRGIHYARCILQQCGLSRVPVADGGDTGVHPFSPFLRGAVELIMSQVFAGCTESEAPARISAEELLTWSVLSSARRVQLITTGPLTNVANALRLLDGRLLAARIERTTVMGGAVNVAGNLFVDALPTYDNTQEQNLWADPPAAQHVLETMRPGTTWFVPLDATNHVPMTPEFAERIRLDSTTSEAGIVRDIINHPLILGAISSGVPIGFWWDPLAAMSAMSAIHHDEEDVVDHQEARLAIVTEEGPSSGRLYVTRHGTRAHYGASADRTRFEDRFVETLNGRDHVDH